MKKKNLKTLLIVIGVAVVVICIAVFSILLTPDARGMNAFDRSKTAASAGGESITMGEFAMGIDNTVNFYSQYYGVTYSGDELKALQENIAKDLLLQKIYINKTNELGLSLTAEEIASCKKAAEEELASLEESIGKQLSTSGNFSTANLQTQINEYFTRSLGMTKSQYKAYIEAQEKASLALEKLNAYYKDELSNYSDEDLIAYYDNLVTEQYAANYTEGSYSMQTYYYLLGYSDSPYLYVPEGFIYIDILAYSAATQEDADAFVAKVNESGDFDALASETGVTSQHDYLPAPYAVGPSDWSYILDSQETYDAAAALEIGDMTAVIVPVTTTDDDGNKAVSSYTVYVIKRVEGTICENGAASGIVDIDHYGLRDSMKTEYENQRFTDLTNGWLTDLNLTDLIYTYPAN